MDPCTQGLLGASLSCSFSKKNQIKTASFCGFVGGLAPDLDIFIKSNEDPLLFIEFHRHFTHSLVFIPVLGLLVAAIIFILSFKKKISFYFYFLYSTLGVSTHGILDSFTSYGTMLYWPFYNDRVAWNLISIVDPIYTFILFFFFAFCFLRKSKKFCHFGLFFSCIYLVICLIKYKQVERIIEDYSVSIGHSIERILLNPTLGNNILWRTVYKYKNHYYINAVYVPYFGISRIKKGEKIEFINEEKIFPDLQSNSIQRNDIRRFSFFSQSFIYLHPEYPNIIGDLRYGTLPFDARSLWGIKVDINNPDNHVKFKNLRNFTNKDYIKFWSMIKGEF